VGYEKQRLLVLLDRCTGQMLASTPCASAAFRAAEPPHASLEQAGVSCCLRSLTAERASAQPGPPVGDGNWPLQWLSGKLVLEWEVWDFLCCLLDRSSSCPGLCCSCFWADPRDTPVWNTV